MLVNAETVYGTRALKQKYFFSKKVRFYRTQKFKKISIPSSVISILSLTTRDLRQMYATPNYDKRLFKSIIISGCGEGSGVVYSD